MGRQTNGRPPGSVPLVVVPDLGVYEAPPAEEYGDADRERLCLDFARAGNFGAAEFLAGDLVDADARDRLLPQIEQLCGAATAPDPVGPVARLKSARQRVRSSAWPQSA